MVYNCIIIIDGAAKVSFLHALRSGSARFGRHLSTQQAIRWRKARLYWENEAAKSVTKISLRKEKQKKSKSKPKISDFKIGIKNKDSIRCCSFRAIEKKWSKLEFQWKIDWSWNPWSKSLTRFYQDQSVFAQVHCSRSIEWEPQGLGLPPSLWHCFNFRLVVLASQPLRDTS